MTRHTTPAVATLLFGSGFCALIYQTVWMRQFRLIFGASTFATAAVLAIFMGGLGLGSVLLGKRADAHSRPLRFYGNLELMIAASAAISPILLWLVAKLYFATGGSVTLGLFSATVVRLLLATIVLAVPTILMGGTLPAAARAVETSDDAGRRRLALLYGMNTLGAVTGTLLSTFFMLETFGNRKTLFMAVLVNALVAMVARTLVAPDVILSREDGEGSARVGNGSAPVHADPSPSTRLRMTSPLVLAAAAIAGFAFLLMELVWYRMLAPLLGGSTFTFGLILAIALFGIGVGGAGYALWSGRARATAGGFALTCSLEALFIALPLVLGDRLAIMENLLRSLGTIGFQGHVLAWTMLTTIVVLPAAIVSGVQFPLLISLLGSGSDDVGRHVGLAYAWNTLGAIAGSLAGGFGLLPLLSAPGAWRLVIVLLALLGIAATFYARRAQALAAGAIAMLAISGVFALGPTSLWRHSGIGAGRSQTPTNRNATREWINSIRRTIVWDRDGRESSVALADGNDYAFIINGKADGSARGDAGTQVMSGMVGATLHPNPRTALVIGLGTGSTAGWLGAVPSMERVDVVELEPAVIGVAAACSAVNHDVLHNPKVKIRIGDAREVLLAGRAKYDVIFSEPSNPYRAGIASLFTREFYEASAARLNRRGIFLQWVQTYDVDAQTIRTIYATIGAVFRNVTTWHTDAGDLLLLATVDPIAIDAGALRQRVGRPPFLSAMSHAWRVESVEGFLAHFVATDAMTRLIAQRETEINTDDRTVIEFGFARGVGADTHFDMDTIAALARSRGEDRPPVRGVIDWKIVDQNRSSFPYINQMPNSPGRELQNRHRAAHLYSSGALTDILTLWRGQTFPPVNTAELAMLAESLADAGSTSAAAYAEQLRPWRPADADAILARLRYRQNDPAGAATLLARAWMECRRDPWPTVDLIGRTFPLADLLATQNAQALQLFHALDVPFAGGQWEDERRLYRVRLAGLIEGCGPRTVAALRAVEPWPPWRKDFLKQRRDCYASAMSPLADRANRELREFLEDEAEGLLR